MKSLTGYPACGADPTPPDLSRIYAHANGVDARNPVITVPGLLGSRLVDTESGVMIWGGGDRLSADPSIPEEALAIAHPIGPPDAPLWEIRDAVRTDGVARIVRASFLGLTQPFDIYRGLIRTLIAGGYDFRETRRRRSRSASSISTPSNFPMTGGATSSRPRPTSPISSSARNSRCATSASACWATPARRCGSTWSATRWARW
jgi:hypothetical protein